jgi:type I restriction enzyme R subunit
MGMQDISDLNAAHLDRLTRSETPHLAVEALRRLIEQKMREVIKHNVIRQESFAKRLEELMMRSMRQQLTSAQMIAELVAMAKEVSADARRGERFDPPLNHAELAFYDAVANHGTSFVELSGGCWRRTTTRRMRSEKPSTLS